MRPFVSRLPVGLFAVFAFLFASASSASAQSTPFTEARFDSLQAAGELVLVDVWADWCPTCAKQEKVLAKYHEKYPDSPIHFLKVDFDSQKKWVKHFKAPRQSTFILFRGEERLWFSVAETRERVVFATLNDAVSDE